MKKLLCNVPEEMWYEILKRLPSKSLCCFLSVSKQWHRLITSQAFISSHLKHNANTQIYTHLLLKVFRHISDCRTGKFLFYPHLQINKIGIGNLVSGPIGQGAGSVRQCLVGVGHDDDEKHNNSRHEYFGVPFLKPKPPPIISDRSSYKILGTCNGLICLKNNFDFILWNPSINKYVELPRFSITILLIVRWVVFGFGVNLLDGDFKVVRVIVTQKTFSSPLDAPPLVEVYSLKARKWVEIEINIVSHNPLFLSSSPQVYMNGCSHWINKLAGNETACSIVSFDMSDEVFREVTLPKQVAPMSERISSNLNDWVKLVTMNLRENECLGIVIEGRRTIGIWVMEEYGVFESWTNMYSIDMRSIEGTYRFAGFTKNGDILMRESQGKLSQAAISKHQKSVSRLRIHSSEFYVGHYVESLVLLESGCNI